MLYLRWTGFLPGPEVFFIYFAFSDEFVLQKLKKECVDDGVYLLRWSVLDYRRIILAVLSRTEVTFMFVFFGKFNRRNVSSS